jgi:hypothetical protein
MLPRDLTAERRLSIINSQERRHWRRVQVNWGIVLFRAESSDPVSATLLNISSGGVYFVSAMDVSPGELLTGQISIPAHILGYNGFAITLTCNMRVLRCTEAPSNEFGVACRIDDYSVHWPNQNGAAAND